MTTQNSFLYQNIRNSGKERFLTWGVIYLSLIHIFIVGRAADYVLRDRRDVVKIFIHASREYRIGRAMEVYGDTREEAEENIRRSDRARAAYYHHISGRRWGEAANYDLTVDSSRGVPQAAEEILRYLEANGLADLQSVR